MQTATNRTTVIEAGKFTFNKFDDVVGADLLAELPIRVLTQAEVNALVAAKAAKQRRQVEQHAYDNGQSYHTDDPFDVTPVAIFSGAAVREMVGRLLNFSAEGTIRESGTVYRAKFVHGRPDEGMALITGDDRTACLEKIAATFAFECRYFWSNGQTGNVILTPVTPKHDQHAHQLMKAIEKGHPAFRREHSHLFVDVSKLRPGRR